MREAQFPGVPASSSLDPAKTTAAPPARTDLAARASATATVTAGAAGTAAVSPRVAGASPRAGRKTVHRCFVEHLRANLARHPETASEVDLPSTLDPHHCCDLETIGTTQPTDLAPLHANVHDPHGPDGVADVVEHIKANSDDLTMAEIKMRTRAELVNARDATLSDATLSVDECVVSLKDPMSSQRMTAPGKGTNCEHVECFDLVTFLRATLRATRFSQRSQCADLKKHPTCHPLHTKEKHVGRCDYCKHWRCPICRKPLALNQLEYDAFIADVLAKTDAERVRVKPKDSHWEPERAPPRPPPRNDKTDSEDEEAEAFARRDEDIKTEAPAPEPARAAAGPPDVAGPPIVIDLEEEEEAPAPAPPAARTEAEEEEELAPHPAPLAPPVPPPPPIVAPAPAAPVPPPVVPAPSESPHAKRRADTSPPMDPRRQKAPRRAAVTIAPMDPVGAAARPTSTVTTTVTLAKRPAIPRVQVPVQPSSASAGVRTSDLNSPRAAAPARARDELVDPAVFARVGEVLRTVETALRAEDVSAWCDRASVVRSVEHRAVEQLTQWMEKTYAMTRALKHANRVGLKAALTKYETGAKFQTFRKLVREKRLRETTPIGKELHAILEFMSHTRDWWKAIVREAELPAPLPLNRDGSYKTPPMEASSGGAGEHALADGAERASKGKGSKESKAKEKKRARAETASPVASGGAAKKFASNATKPPSASVSRPKKQKQKRRLPSHCDARGHGHCEWTGTTPLKQHPKLKHVAICEGCLAFYYSTPFNVGRDGYYEQCRCCSDGGEHIVCCDQCMGVFCRPCIANLGGKAYAKDVDDVDKWRCFSCDPEAVAKGR